MNGTLIKLSAFQLSVMIDIWGKECQGTIKRVRFLLVTELLFVSVVD